MKASIAALLRLIALGLMCCLTSCADVPTRVDSKLTDHPTKRINSLIIWHMQGVEQNDWHTKEYLPEFIKSLVKNLDKEGITSKTITTANLSLRTPQDEVNEYVQKTGLTNVLKIYITNVSTVKSGSSSTTFFQIKIDLINFIDNHSLWEATVFPGWSSNILFSSNDSIESVALALFNKLQADGMLHL